MPKLDGILETAIHTEDMVRARAFYEGMGWSSGAAPGDDVVFFQTPGCIVALWDRAALAEDSVVADSGGWGGITLACNVRSPEEVETVRLRYHSEPLACRVHVHDDGSIDLELDQAANGVAPGQLACLMRQDRVVGEGTIGEPR